MVNSIFNNTPVFSQNININDHRFIDSENISSYKIGDKGQIIQRGAINQAFRNFLDKFSSEQSIRERNINVAMNIVKLRQTHLEEMPATEDKSHEKNLLKFSMNTCKDAIDLAVARSGNSTQGDISMLRQCLNSIMERMNAIDEGDNDSLYKTYAELTEINKIAHMDKSISKNIACINLGFKYMQHDDIMSSTNYKVAINTLLNEFKKLVGSKIINKTDSNHSSIIAQKYLAKLSSDEINSHNQDELRIATERAISLVSSMVKGYDDGLNSVVKAGIELLKNDDQTDVNLQNALKNAFKEKILRSTFMTEGEKKLNCEFLEKEFSTLGDEVKRGVSFVQNEKGHQVPDLNELSVVTLSKAVAKQIETLDRIIFNDSVELNNTDPSVSANVIDGYKDALNAMPKVADSFKNKLQANFGNLLNQTGIILNDYHLQPGGPQQMFDGELPAGDGNKARQYELFLSSAYDAKGNHFNDIDKNDSSLFYSTCLTRELQAFHAGQIKKVPNQVIDFVQLAMSEAGQNALCKAAIGLMNTSLPQAHLDVTNVNSAMLTTAPKLSTDLHGNIQLQMDFVQNISISGLQANEHTFNTQAAMQATMSIPAEQGQVNVADGILPNFNLSLSYRPSTASE